MTAIDPSARIADGAIIGPGTHIGPFCTIGPNVTIGPNCRFISHVNVTGHTTIGSGCTVHPFASLGGDPQSSGYRGEPTRLEVGDDNIIRESVTFNIGTATGGGITKVGSRGFFMACSHVGHDCTLGNDIVMANAVVLGGHCTVGDFVFIGGATAVHQFCNIGSQVMVAGLTGVAGDVIPFAYASGRPAKLVGLNLVGMKRRHFTKQRIAMIHAVYRDLFHGEGLFVDRLAQLKADAPADPAVIEILEFVSRDRKRELAMAASARVRK